MVKKIFFICIVGLSLSACSILKPVKNPSIHKYNLTGVNTTIYSKHKNNSTILVSTPMANPGYQTNKIIYIKKPHQLDSFSLNQWAAPPATLITPILIQSLQNTHKYESIVQAPFAGFAKYRIDSQLLYLQQNFLYNPSRVQLGLNIQIINQNTQKIIASRQFRFTQKTKQDNPYSGVIATNKLFTRAMTQISKFIVRKIN